jgi:hypothetical protein
MATEQNEYVRVIENVLEDGSILGQLLAVTKDSEEKATSIFDELEDVATNLDDAIKSVEDEKAKATIAKAILSLRQAMSNLQFQDINRQKIERVMHAMNAVSNILSDGDSIVDGTLPPAPRHIDGDNTDDLVDDDELAKLIAEHGN